MLHGRNTGSRLRVLRQSSPEVMVLMDHMEALPTPSASRIETLTSKGQSEIVQHPSNSGVSVSRKRKAQKLLTSNAEVCGKPSEILTRYTQIDALRTPSVSKTKTQRTNIEPRILQRPSNPGESTYENDQTVEEETVGKQVCGMADTECMVESTGAEPMEEEPGEREVIGRTGMEQKALTETAVENATEAMEEPVGIGVIEKESTAETMAGEALERQHPLSHWLKKNALKKKRKAREEPSQVLFENLKIKANVTSKVAISGKEQVRSPACRRTLQMWSIAKALDHQTVPSTFLCRAKILRYWPEVTSEYVKYVCRVCRNVLSTGEFLDVGSARTCPNTSCGKPLYLALLVSLVITDGKDVLDATVFDKCAKEFFSDVDPASLLTDQDTQRSVDERMRSLRDGNISLDFVMKSYYGPKDENGDEYVMYRVTKMCFPVACSLKRERTHANEFTKLSIPST